MNESGSLLIFVIESEIPLKKLSLPTLGRRPIIIKELMTITSLEKRGNSLDIVIFYALAFAGILVSYQKDRQKTRQSLKKAWKAFETMLPAFALILLLIGMSLALIEPAAVSKLLGSESGFGGVLIAAVIGSITLIPGFIAFPLARTVLDIGGGIMQVAAFISTLMMVGVVTAPMESQFFSRKAMLLRNGLSLIFSFLVALILARVVS